MRTDAPARSTGWVPVGVATGPTLEERKIIMVPWNRASVLHREGVGHFSNPHGINAIVENEEIPAADLEAWKIQRRAATPDKRRTGRERAQKLAVELFKMGLNSTRMFGKPVWPTSIQDRLDGLGVGNKDLYTQVDALVGHSMLRAENAQKEADQKRTVTDWHGHYD